MSGYCQDYSRSRNAEYAENFEGKLPASRVGRLYGVSAAAVREVLIPCEWHHTSSRYNVTDYYAPIDDDETVVQLMSAEKKIRGTKRRTTYYAAATLRWTEFEGTRRHCRAVPREEIAPAMVRGDWATITLADGAEIRKNLTARSFGSLQGEQCDEATYRAAVAARAEELERIRARQAEERAAAEARRAAEKIATEEACRRRTAADINPDAAPEDRELALRYVALSGRERKQFAYHHRPALKRAGVKS